MQSCRARNSDRSFGLVSEKGSLLSHTAIIGRELSLPTVVGVKNATRILKNGMKVKMIEAPIEMQSVDVPEDIKKVERIILNKKS